MVRLQEQHRINGLGRQQGIVIVVQNRLNVLKSFVSRALADVLKKGGIDVHGINFGVAGSPSGPYRKPAGTGTDVRHGYTWLDAQDIHHTLHLELLRAILGIEPGDIASVRWAGLTRLRSRRPLGARVLSYELRRACERHRKEQNNNCEILGSGESHRLCINFVGRLCASHADCDEILGCLVASASALGLGDT